MATDTVSHTVRHSITKVNEEMSDIENMVCAMERENAEGRDKLVRERDVVCDKCFACNELLTMQIIMNCWKYWTRQQDQVRKAEHYSHQGVREATRYQQHIADLQVQADQLRVKVQSMHEDTQDKLKHIRSEREAAEKRAERLHATVVQMEEMASRIVELAEKSSDNENLPVLPDMDPVEHAKDTLEQLLCEIRPESTSSPLKADGASKVISGMHRRRQLQEFRRTAGPAATTWPPL